MIKTLLLLLFFTSQIFSQFLSGFVFDKSTGQPLPNCNISLLGTNRGTITNNNGYYSLQLKSGDNTILFQYIGYKSNKIQIKNIEKAMVENIYLTPQIYLFEGIIVYGNEYSAAEQLILKASEEKKNHLKYLKNYSCKSYTKTSIIGVLDSLKMKYGGIFETYSNVIWNYPDSWYEIIYSQKQSANLPQSFNFFIGNTFLDVNSDKIYLGKKVIIGPTAPNAIEHYSYEILDTLYQDNNRIYRLSIKPKKNNRPAMSGTIFILDKFFLIQKIDVLFNTSADYDWYKNTHIIQQYKAINDSTFLPYYSFRESDLSEDISIIQKLIIRKTNFREDYTINKAENAIYAGKNESLININISFDSIPMNIPPLTYSEKKGYARIDSIVQNKPLIHFATGLLKLYDFYAYLKSKSVGDFSDIYRFNRIEGNFVGLAINTRENILPFQIYSGAGYGLSDKRTKYFISPGLNFKFNSFQIYGNVNKYNTISSRESHNEFPVWINTFYAIFNNFDYFDYYYSNGFSSKIGIRKSPFSLSVAYFNEQHTNAIRTLRYSIFKEKEFDSNINIIENRLAGTKVIFKYSNAQYLLSDLYNKISPNKNYIDNELLFEYGNKYFGSDLNYHKWLLTLFVRQNTFYNGFLDLTISVGYGNKSLPVQKMFELESGFPGYDRLRTFMTLNSNAFIGHNKIAFYIEHNFHNSFFSYSRIPYVKDIDLDFSILLNTGWAGSEEVDKFNINKLYSEIGFGVGRIFNLFKINFLWRLRNAPNSSNFAFDIKLVEIEL